MISDMGKSLPMPVDSGGRRLWHFPRGENPMTTTPHPRFDLLNFDCYDSMSTQFSRGCLPFQCEFCDIIVRRSQAFEQKPSPAVVLNIFTSWGGDVCFMVDDKSSQ